MRRLLALVLLALLAGCAAQPETAVETPAPTSSPVEFNQELHDELIGMLERDQAGRTGGVDNEGDQARTNRLTEIMDEFGWPTFDLVGEDGEDAAWAIAQHSDLQPQVQVRALELLEEAVDRGQASPGNLAYLTDRVAVAAGKQQTYGTQVGCGPDGPEPATPIKDADDVEARRAAADLEPLADYLEEMAAICAEG